MSLQRHVALFAFGLFMITHGMRAQGIRAIALGGYQFQYAPLTELNYVISRFNETRTSLVKPMTEIQSLSGPSFAVGVGGGQLGVLFSYGHFQKTRSGSFLERGQSRQNSLKMKSQQYSLAFSALPGKGNKVAFGMGLELSYLKTKYWLEKGTDPFAEVMDHKSIGATPFFQLYVGMSESLALFLKPYYTLDIFYSDFFPINKALNPNTADQDRLKHSHEGRYNRAGFFAGIAYIIGN